MESTSNFVKQHSAPNIYVTFGQILCEVVAICLLVYVGIVVSNLFLTILLICFIGARQHGLLIISHDIWHYRAAKSKFVNELLGYMILVPFGIKLQDARKRHLQHHQELNTENDPDYINKVDNQEFKFPQTKAMFLKNTLKYLFGIHFFVEFIKNKNKKEALKYFLKGFLATRKVKGVKYSLSKPELVSVVLFNCCLWAVLISSGWFVYYLVYWVAPIVFYLPFVNRIRSICEHWGIKKMEIEMSRTYKANWFDYIVFGLSWNVGYHLEHHLYPSVPCYNLHKLHKFLMKNDKDFVQKAQITENGVYGIFKECTT